MEAFFAKLIIICLISALAVFICILILTWLAYNRAIKEKPYTYNEGMVVDLKTNKLISTKTPVYKDFKTGMLFYGKTILEK